MESQKNKVMGLSNYLKEQPFKTIGLIFQAIGIVVIWATLIIFMFFGQASGDLIIGFICGIITAKIGREVCIDLDKIYKGERL